MNRVQTVITRWQIVSERQRNGQTPRQNDRSTTPRMVKHNKRASRHSSRQQPRSIIRRQQQKTSTLIPYQRSWAVQRTEWWWKRLRVLRREQRRTLGPYSRRPEGQEGKKRKISFFVKKIPNYRIVVAR